MRTIINIDKGPIKLVNDLLAAEEQQDVLLSQEITVNSSFQEYIESEWLKHFGDRRSSNPDLSMFTKRP